MKRNPFDRSSLNREKERGIKWGARKEKKEFTSTKITTTMPVISVRFQVLKIVQNEQLIRESRRKT